MSSVLPTENRVIRLLVADSTRMSAQLLADALQGNGVLEIVGTCTTAEEVLAAVGSHNPDVAIISACMHEQPLKGFDVVRQMRARHPGSKAIMLLDSSKRDLILASFGAGARGVFCRSESIASLRKCILSVHAGQVWASSNELQHVLEAFASANPPRLLDARGAVLLSKREEEVVRCVTEGLTNREIAERLQLSEHTVKNYIFRIFDKLGVSTRVEMVLYAFSQRTEIPKAKSGTESKPTLDLESCRGAAEQGLAIAQLTLAEIYREGRVVPKDPVMAYKWFRVALRTSEEQVRRSKAALQRLGARMTLEKCAEADRQATDWLISHTNSGGPTPIDAANTLFSSPKPPRRVRQSLAV